MIQQHLPILKGMIQMSRDETETVEQAVDTEQTPAETVSAESGDTSATEQIPAEGAEQAPAEPTGPTAEEIEQALKAFQESAEAVVNGADQATGILSDDATKPLIEAYAALPVAASRTAVKKWIQLKIRESLMGNAAWKARAFVTIEDALKVSPAARPTAVREPVDPTKAHVEKVLALHLATGFVPLPEGVKDDWATQVKDGAQTLRAEVQTYKAYLAELDAFQAAHDTWAALSDEAKAHEEEGHKVNPEPVEPKAPEVSPIVVNAARIGRGRTSVKSTSTGTKAPREPKAASTATPYSGPRRNVQEHIRQVFASLPVGSSLTVGAIAKTVTAEYPEGNCSQGAVAGALKSPKYSVAGVTPAVVEGHQGATKTA